MDRLSIRDLADLGASWREFPPLCVMVAGYLGVKPTTTATVSAPTEDQLRSFVGLANGLG